MKAWRLVLSAVVISSLGLLSAAAQQTVRTPAQSIRGGFMSIDRKVLEMAKDFPADKYDFRLKPEMRSFGEVIVHIAGGNVYAAKLGRGENANWDEIDAKQFHNKDEIVAMFQKAVDDSESVLKGLPADTFAKNVQPWIGVTEHSAEHYGLLVAYYRANGIVPPESRPKPGSSGN